MFITERFHGCHGKRYAGSVLIQNPQACSPVPPTKMLNSLGITVKIDHSSELGSSNLSLLLPVSTLKRLQSEAATPSAIEAPRPPRGFPSLHGPSTAFSPPPASCSFGAFSGAILSTITFGFSILLGSVEPAGVQSGRVPERNSLCGSRNALRSSRRDAEYLLAQKGRLTLCEDAMISGAVR